MSNVMMHEFLLSILQTIYMVFAAGAVASLIGLPLGVILYATKTKTLLANSLANTVLSSMTNVIRSVPFIILLVTIIPFTRLIVGTSIGTTAAIVPLSIAAIPFFARLVEAALHEVPKGLIETGLSMGATPMQIIFNILIPEAFPGIVSAVTIMMISLIGYSAMAGAIGGGGLGDFAIRYGYNRFEFIALLATIFVLVIIVQAIQLLGDYLVRRFTHR